MSKLKLHPDYQDLVKKLKIALVQDALIKRGTPNFDEILNQALDSGKFDPDELDDLEDEVRDEVNGFLNPEQSPKMSPKRDLTIIDPDSVIMDVIGKHDEEQVQLRNEEIPSDIQQKLQEITRIKLALSLFQNEVEGTYLEPIYEAWDIIVNNGLFGDEYQVYINHSCSSKEVQDAQQTVYLAYQKLIKAIVKDLKNRE